MWSQAGECCWRIWLHLLQTTEWQNEVTEALRSQDGQRETVGSWLTSNVTNQHMPDVLISSFKAAEADGDAEQPLASPQVAGSDCGFPQLKCLG